MNPRIVLFLAICVVILTAIGTVLWGATRQETYGKPMSAGNQKLDEQSSAVQPSVDDPSYQGGSVDNSSNTEGTVSSDISSEQQVPVAASAATTTAKGPKATEQALTGITGAQNDGSDDEPMAIPDDYNQLSEIQMGIGKLLNERKAAGDDDPTPELLAWLRSRTEVASASLDAAKTYIVITYTNGTVERMSL